MVKSTIMELLIMQFSPVTW